MGGLKPPDIIVCVIARVFFPKQSPSFGIATPRKHGAGARLKGSLAMTHEINSLQFVTNLAEEISSPSDVFLLLDTFRGRAINDT